MTNEEILAMVVAGSIGVADAAALIKANSAQSTAGALSCRANPATGGISLYGMQRMPITLHRSQWERLLPGCDRKTHPVLAFIDANAKYLPESKGGKAEPVPASMIGDGKPFRVPKAVEA